MSDDLLSKMGNQYLPLHYSQFFTAQRAPDFWCGDELPPTYQDYLNSPRMQQAQAFLQFQMLQQMSQGG